MTHLQVFIEQQFIVIISVWSWCKYIKGYLHISRKISKVVSLKIDHEYQVRSQMIQRKSCSTSSLIIIACNFELDFSIKNSRPVVTGSWDWTLALNKSYLSRKSKITVFFSCMVVDKSNKKVTRPQMKNDKSPGGAVLHTSHHPTGWPNKEDQNIIRFSPQI